MSHIKFICSNLKHRSQKSPFPLYFFIHCLKSGLPNFSPGSWLTSNQAPLLPSSSLQPSVHTVTGVNVKQMWDDAPNGGVPYGPSGPCLWTCRSFSTGSFQPRQSPFDIPSVLPLACIPGSNCFGQVSQMQCVPLFVVHFHLVLSALLFFF